MKDRLFLLKRPLLTSEIGEENQNYPKHILADDRPAPKGIEIKEANGRRFVSGESEICHYLGRVYGYAEPHD